MEGGKEGPRLRKTVTFNLEANKQYLIPARDRPSPRERARMEHQREMEEFFNNNLPPDNHKAWIGPGGKQNECKCKNKNKPSKHLLDKEEGEEEVFIRGNGLFLENNF